MSGQSPTRPRPLAVIVEGQEHRKEDEIFQNVLNKLLNHTISEKYTPSNKVQELILSCPEALCDSLEGIFFKHGGYPAVLISCLALKAADKAVIKELPEHQICKLAKLASGRPFPQRVEQFLRLCRSQNTWSGLSKPQAPLNRLPHLGKHPFYRQTEDGSKVKRLRSLQPNKGPKLTFNTPSSDTSSAEHLPPAPTFNTSSAAAPTYSIGAQSEQQSKQQERTAKLDIRQLLN